MFNIGTGELLAIMVLALVVLGPDKLPQAARQAGRYLAEFRRISQGFQQEFREAMDVPTTSKPQSGPGPGDLGAGDFHLPALDVTTASDAGSDGNTAPAPSTPGDVHQAPSSIGSVQVDGPSASFS